MADQELRGWDDNEPTDWQATILLHIITINHELGDVVRDLAWTQNVVKLILVIVILLALSQADNFINVARRALDLLT